MPPFAVARLGASDTPLEAFEWVEDETTHGSGKTVIKPALSLEVRNDGSIRPYTPSVIRFRDGSEGLIRPTAPFFELWARFEDEKDPRPLTASVLSALGGGLDRIVYTIRAANLKAARRTGDPACGFAATVVVRGNDFRPKDLLASSPNPPGSQPLVLSSNPILLGHVQVIRPKQETSAGQDLDTLRLRITPGRGDVYGPPSTGALADPDDPSETPFEVVPPARRILNGDAAWARFEGRNAGDGPQPADTFDGVVDLPDGNFGGRSLGVVDDTCDILIEVSVEIGAEQFSATARATAAPPDFAPDRRPFMSLADDLADRELPPLDVTRPEAADEVVDLLRRVFETVSLLNLDSLHADAQAASAPRPNPVPVVGPGTMTGADRPLAQHTVAVLGRDQPGRRLVYWQIANDVHGERADVESMLELFRTDGDRLRHLLRPPYARLKDLPARPPAAPPTERIPLQPRPIGLKPRPRDPRVDRDGVDDMRMPPYMRDSDASPLSLTFRQYQAIIAFIARVEKAGPKELAQLSPAQRHATQVAERRRAAEGAPPPANNAGPRNARARTARGKRRRSPK